MGTKLHPRLQRIAEKLAERFGVEECRLTSATFSNCDFAIKESKLLSLLTFGRVRGLSVDVCADSESSFTARLKLIVRKKP